MLQMWHNLCSRVAALGEAAVRCEFPSGWAAACCWCQRRHFTAVNNLYMKSKRKDAELLNQTASVPLLCGHLLAKRTQRQHYHCSGISGWTK